MSKGIQQSLTDNGDAIRDCNHIFKRCGLASIEDIHSDCCEELFQLMTIEQKKFLEHEDFFRSPDYIWPRDALNNWSRIWEYPYVYYHLRNWRAIEREKEPLALLDYGSGVTFFPFAISKLNYNVVCVDIDPVCVKDTATATDYVPHGPGKVSSCLLDGSKIPLENASIDGSYCVSVLEHLPRFEITIDELYRVIKPDGLLILTIDLSLGPIDEISPSRFRELMDLLQAKFEFVYPHTTIHPNDLLTTKNSKFATRSLSLPHFIFYTLKQMIKKLINRQPRWKPRPDLAIMAMVLRKS